MDRDSRPRRQVVKGGLLAGIVGLAGCSAQDQETVTPGDGGGTGTTEGGDGTETPTEETETPEPDVEYKQVPTQKFITRSRSAAPVMYEWSLLVRQQLERLGFRFEWTVLSGTAFGDQLFAREWDFNTNAWGATPDRIFPYYQMYSSFASEFAEDGGSNFEMWADEEKLGDVGAAGKEEYDQLVQEFRGEIDQEARSEIGNRLQFLQGANQPVNFTVHPNALAATNTRQFGNWKSMFGNFPFWNMYTLRDIENQGQTDTLVFGTTAPQERGYPNIFTMAATNNKIMYNMTYDPLTRLDYEGRPQPAAASDWTIVDDQTIEVTLREGMTFHDGEPVTPEDVKFTWDYISEHGIPEEIILYQPYDSSEVIGDRQIRFNLAFPFAGFPTINMYRIPILPKHIWENVVEEEGLEHPRQWSNPDMTGSGPFEYVGFEPGSQIVVEKNPDHYWADQIDFDRFVYRIYGSQAAIVGDLTTGAVHFASGLSATHWNRASNADSVNAVSNPNIRTGGVWCRCDKAPFTDVRVRQALQHAINNQDIIDVVFQGHGVPARSVIAPANKVYYYEDTPQMETSLQMARQKLTEAGLRWNEQGQLIMPVDWEPTTEYISTSEF